MFQDQTEGHLFLSPSLGGMRDILGDIIVSSSYGKAGSVNHINHLIGDILGDTGGQKGQFDTLGEGDKKGQSL